MMRWLIRLRAWVRPDIPELAGWLWDLLRDHPVFLLAAAAHDGIAKRNRNFDDQRWWHPIV
jgi:hypothetical protein